LYIYNTLVLRTTCASGQSWNIVKSCYLTPFMYRYLNVDCIIDVFDVYLLLAD